MTGWKKRQIANVNPEKYSEYFDAFFNEVTNEWLESTCADPNCSFCIGRPERPLDLRKGVTAGAREMAREIDREVLSMALGENTENFCGSLRGPEKKIQEEKNEKSEGNPRK